MKKALIALTLGLAMIVAVVHRLQNQKSSSQPKVSSSPTMLRWGHSSLKEPTSELMVGLMTMRGAVETLEIKSLDPDHPRNYRFSSYPDAYEAYLTRTNSKFNEPWVNHWHDKNFRYSLTTEPDGRKIGVRVSNSPLFSEGIEISADKHLKVLWRKSGYFAPCISAEKEKRLVIFSTKRKFDGSIPSTEVFELKTGIKIPVPAIENATIKRWNSVKNSLAIIQSNSALENDNAIIVIDYKKLKSTWRQIARQVG